MCVQEVRGIIRDEKIQIGMAYKKKASGSLECFRASSCALEMKGTKFRGLLRGVLLARPKVTTQGCRRVARSAAGLVRANPPTGHHLPSRPSPSAICDLPPAGCCSASHQLAHLRIPWSNSWWQGMPRQHNQMQPQRQPPAGPSAHSPVQFLAPRPAGPHNQRQPRRPPACSPDRTN